MQIYDGQLLYSASDLAGFLECFHLTALELRNLETPLPAAEDDDQARLLQEKGFAHEAAYLERLRSEGADVLDLGEERQGLADKFEATRRAMAEGRDVIFQACLYAPPFVGHADFLRRVPRASALGDFSYEVVDTKLARSPRAKFIIQLSLYSELLAGVQGVLPHRFHLVLGDGTESSFGLASYLRYFRKLRERFLAFAAAVPPDSYPERCSHCDLCRWRNLCAEKWARDDHLNQVANISKIQIGKLRERANVRTLAELARLDPGTRVRGIQDTTLDRLRSQAALQLAKRETGENRVEVLPPDFFGRRGFHRLPEPDVGDVFFDMEGDPLEDGGLEYLFGAYFQDADGPHFLPFWGHDRNAEREAFRNFMAFVTERLARHPRMHIYHYGQYEINALKRLMSLHGVCEAEVDNLLRTERLVDLYRVVREGIRVSEPGYSIKNLEAFYMAKRTGAVKDAGTSVVWYEQWKQTGDSALLAQIEDYNQDDCRSTALLRDWLLSLRPNGLPWYQGKPKPDDGEGQNQQIHEVEARLAEYGERLVGSLPDDRKLWDSEAEFRELVFHLLDFHRRADKQVWWAMFARHEMTEEELVDDPESIGGLELLTDSAPEQVKRSAIYSYQFPEQEHKRRVGENCLVAETLATAGTIVEIDEPNRIVRIKRALRNGPLPDRFSLIPPGPIKNKVLREALYRFADSILDGDERYPALTGVLRRERPTIDGLSPGKPIVPAGTDLLEQTIDAVKRLNSSHVFIQGPPGAGKTYTGSHVIVALLRAGKRVGVSSNSNAAINNLLKAVEAHAAELGFTFRGVKKSTSDDARFNGTFVVDIASNDDVIHADATLLAGTAWLFADPRMDQALDYLFVDEAGQVALANLIAMGTAARNVILLGDQMQLQQPIQGVHAGHSGESSLDYLLQGEATIAPDRGIFLGVTWRMHEDVCRFISDAIYDSRLVAEPANQNQCLVLGAEAHLALRPTGVRLVPAIHDGCSQRSVEEARLVHELYQSLLKQSYRDRAGQLHPMAAQNILVVAPYNMQVNLLRETLPAGARVGTVDKFQGQEAEVVIVSMATSSGGYLPRFIEFLYSKNRLNVAISRARCLALLVASPELLAIRCHTPEQIELVNTLCWVEEYATGLSREPPQCALPTVR